MIINFINIQEHLLEIANYSLTVLIDYPQNLTNADILGQGNLNLVSEKSGKSQGILLSIICGNPVIAFNAGQKNCRMHQGEHSAILSTFIKLPFVIEIFILSIFERSFYVGFIV